MGEGSCDQSNKKLHWLPGLASSLPLPRLWPLGCIPPATLRTLCPNRFRICWKQHPFLPWSRLFQTGPPWWKQPCKTTSTRPAPLAKFLKCCAPIWAVTICVTCSPRFCSPILRTTPPIWVRTLHGSPTRLTATMPCMPIQKPMMPLAASSPTGTATHRARSTARPWWNTKARPSTPTACARAAGILAPRKPARKACSTRSLTSCRARPNG